MQLHLPHHIRAEIAEHAQHEAPNECCGYCAGLRRGSKRIITRCYRLRNVARSSSRYAMDPEEQFRTLDYARHAGLQLLCVYHSHPIGPADMSDVDLSLTHDPRMVYLIYSLEEDRLVAYCTNPHTGVLPVDIGVDELTENAGAARTENLRQAGGSRGLATGLPSRSEHS